MLEAPNRRREALRPGAHRFALLVGLALLGGCFRAKDLGPLFGKQGTGGGGGGNQQGYDVGFGGGVVLKDLFAGAVIQQASPTVDRTWPPANQGDVDVRTLLAVQFSESVETGSARAGILLFPSGSSTPVPGSLQLYQGNRVAVFQPTADLVPATSYQLTISGNITDLQGRQLQTSGGGIDQRVSFTTASLNANQPLSVSYAAPKQQQGSVTRSADIVLLFSEPVNSGTTGPGLMAPGNLVLTENGKTLPAGLAGDYVVTALGGARLMGVRVTFSRLLAANASLRLKIDSDVESADGLKTFAGGKGYTLDYTVQDTSVPFDLRFPGSEGLGGTDGWLSVVNLDQFDAEVDLTNDGLAPDKTTLIFFDASQQNALVFEQNAANPTVYQVDLEPDANNPALKDGAILVGAFVQRKQFRSEVSILEVLTKDTVPPKLASMGDPSVSIGIGPFSFGSVFYSYVRDPVLYGTMDEPCLGVQVDFNATSPADFSSIQWSESVSTAALDFFLTGPTRDLKRAPQLDPYVAFAFIAADQFGNGAATANAVTLATVGVAGAAVPNPDGVSALVVQAYDQEDFFAIGDGTSGTYGMVVVDSWPPDPAGAGQVVKGFATSGSLVRFTDAELPASPAIMVTVVANGYHVLSYAGLTKPTAAKPVALLPLLEPVQASTDPSVVVNTLGVGTGSVVRLGASDGDMDPSTPQRERVAVLAQSGDSQTLAPNRPQFLVGIESPTGGGQIVTSVDPLSLPAGAGPAVQGLPSLDFQGLPKDNSSTPGVARQVTFTDTDVVAGGAVGLAGTETDQYRSCRLVVRLPGFVEPVAVSTQAGARFTGYGNGGDPTRVATVLKPSSFLVNDSVATTGHEDGFLEMILQPDLVDLTGVPPAAVDTAAQDQAILVELHVEDTVDAGAQPSAAFTRQRFFTDQASLTAAFQAVPVLSVTDATHPPLLSWTEVTGSNAVHRCTLKEAGGREWRIYPPAVGGGPVPLQVPLIAAGFLDVALDGSSQNIAFEFGAAGTYQAWVDSVDFDPVTGARVFTFDFDHWFQTDLEREHFAWSRSDPNAPLVTN